MNKDVEQALDQIHARQYYKKYQDSGRPITLVGVAFKDDQKTLKVESVQEDMS